MSDAARLNPPQPMSRAEFLAFADNRQEGEWDLVMGVPVQTRGPDDGPSAMTGPRAIHRKIQKRLIAALDARLPAGCEAHFELSVTPQTEADSVLEPDITIACEAIDDDARVIENPLIIIEILSPSTRDYDLGTKLALYKTIPSVTAILLVDSARRWVQLWRLEDGLWTGRDHVGAARLEVPGLTGMLDFNAIYGS